jgi:hypothetical protein
MRPKTCVPWEPHPNGFPATPTVGVAVLGAGADHPDATIASRLCAHPAYYLADVRVGPCAGAEPVVGIIEQVPPEPPLELGESGYFLLGRRQSSMGPAKRDRDGNSITVHARDDAGAHPLLSRRAAGRRPPRRCQSDSTFRGERRAVAEVQLQLVLRAGRLALLRQNFVLSASRAASRPQRASFVPWGMRPTPPAAIARGP